MTIKTGSGVALLVAAVLLFVNNIADGLADVQYWHDAGVTLFTPSFVAASLKQLIPMITTAVGANLLPTMGSGSQSTGGQKL